MKKILCLVMCLILVAFSLVGCAEDEIGADLEKYKDIYKPIVVNEVELDFYIIVGEGTTDNAIDTVELLVNQYLEDMKTKLDIHYVTADEYIATVTADVAATGDDRADIVLINSPELFDTLYESNALANIASFYDSTAYGRLNTQICGALLDSIVIPEDAVNKNGVTYISNNKYVVPNNTIVGHYDYALIKTEVANYFNYGSDKIAEMIDEESCAELKARIEAYGAEQGYTVEDSIKFVEGTYADKARYESEGYTCNIVSVPVVNSGDAYYSAFGIVRHELDERYANRWLETNATNEAAYLTHYDRCMQVIYELNTSEEFRNLLQYGRVGTNYKLDGNGNVDRSTVSADDIYVMDIRFTGDLFRAYFCDELGWNEDVYEYGTLQNKDAIFVPDIVDGD